MTELDQVLAKALASEGNQEDVNKVYLTMLRTLFFLPVRKEKDLNDSEPFRPLFAKVENNYFVMTFDTLDRLKNWAADQFDKMDFVEILGKDVIAGLSDNVYLCVNYGTETYKEFSPDEVKRLKTIVSKIEQLKAD